MTLESKLKEVKRQIKILSDKVKRDRERFNNIPLENFDQILKETRILLMDAERGIELFNEAAVYKRMLGLEDIEKQSGLTK